MEIILHENFLQDVSIYTTVKAFWEKEIQLVLNEFGLQQHFIWNVEDDGNPIFAAKIIFGKAIRITQQEVDELPGYLNAWTKVTEDQEAWPIDELVLSLNLTTKTKEAALNLIREWAKPQTTRTAINFYIENNL